MFSLQINIPHAVKRRILEYSGHSESEVKLSKDVFDEAERLVYVMLDGSIFQRFLVCEQVVAVRMLLPRIYARHGVALAHIRCRVVYAISIARKAFFSQSVLLFHTLPSVSLKAT